MRINIVPKSEAKKRVLSQFPRKEDDISIEDDLKTLEHEYQIGMSIYQYMVSDACQVDDVIKTCLRNTEPEEYGHDSFYVEVPLSYVEVSLRLSTNTVYSRNMEVELENPDGKLTKLKVIVDVCHKIPEESEGELVEYIHTAIIHVKYSEITD